MATRSASSAAARSSTASPSEMKAVSSSGEVRPAALPLSTSPSSTSGTSSATVPSRTASRRSPDSLSVDSRASTKRRAAATVAPSSSRVVGMLEPTALMCAPGANQPRSTIGSRAVVAVTTTSASRNASSTDAAARRIDAVALGRLGRQLRCGLGATRVDAHPLERHHARHGLDVRGRLHSRAQHRKRRRALARERACGDGADGGGADGGHGRGVDEAVHAAVLAAEDDHDALVGVEAAPRILGEDRHGLEPVGRPCLRRGAPSSGPGSRATGAVARPSAAAGRARRRRAPAARCPSPRCNRASAARCEHRRR